MILLINSSAALISPHPPNWLRTNHAMSVAQLKLSKSKAEQLVEIPWPPQRRKTEFQQVA